MRTIVRISLLLLLAWPLTGFHGNRAELYVDMAEEMQSLGAIGRALDYLEMAIRTDPGYARAYTSRGFLHLQGGRADLALADFSRVVELNPRDPAGYLTRALVYNRSGDKERAAADFRKGCELGDQGACAFLEELNESE